MEADVRNANKVALGRKTAFVMAAKKPGRYTDRDFPALGLQVSPKGRAVWFARFKCAASGKEHRTTLGLAALVGDGALTFDYEAAKERAMEAMREAARPPEQSRGVEQYATLAGVWDTFLRDRRTKRGQPLSDVTKRDYDKWFRTALAPVHDWRLKEVPAMRWVEFLTGVRSKYSEPKALYMSNILSAVYSFLMGLDLVDYNPMSKVRLGRHFVAPRPRSAHVPTLHLRAFYEGIDAALTRRDSRDAVRLLFLSGMRLTAALGMKWEHLDLDNGFYFVPRGLAGWKGFTGVYPLSDCVVALLRERGERRERDTYVFPKRHGPADSGLPHLSRASDSIRKVCAWAGIERVGAHDLRRTMATVARLAFGAELDKVAVLLAHNWAVDEAGMTQPRGAITQRYIQRELVALRAIANEAASVMLQLVGERPMSTVTLERLASAGHSVEALRLEEVPAEDDEEEGAM